MKMTLTELEFIRLLPQFMRGDSAVKGLSIGLDIIIPKLANSVQYLSTWDQIDHLSEAELDDLAWELNILWYDHAADIEVKREVVKNSDKVYQHLGTKWAVENVIQTYFGNGYIREWYEYDGKPGFFRVYSHNLTLGIEQRESFLNMLYKVKRASAKLESIVLIFDTMEHTERFGGLMGSIMTTPVPEREDVFDFRHTLRMGGDVSSIMTTPVPEKADIFNYRSAVRVGGGIGSITTMPLPEV